MLTLIAEPRRDHAQVSRQMNAAREHLGACRRCDLCSSRSKIVFGAGNPAAAIMVITERPNYFEDKVGMPLVKTSGAVISDTLSRIGLIPKRDIFATNLVKCITPYQKYGDEVRRAPVSEEQFSKCRPYLEWQVNAVKPAFIVLQGKGASKRLLGDNRSFNQYVGHWRSYGAKCLVLSTHNPAGFFGERAYLVEDYRKHWQSLAERLHLLGRMWRPDAPTFKAGWEYTDD